MVVSSGVLRVQGTNVRTHEPLSQFLGLNILKKDKYLHVIEGYIILFLSHIKSHHAARCAGVLCDALMKGLWWNRCRNGGSTSPEVKGVNRPPVVHRPGIMSFAFGEETLKVADVEVGSVVIGR